MLWKYLLIHLCLVDVYRIRISRAIADDPKLSPRQKRELELIIERQGNKPDRHSPPPLKPTKETKFESLTDLIKDL